MLRPSGFRPKITPDSLAALAVALAPLAYFFAAVRGELILCPDEGVIFNVPIRAAAARIAAGGDFPLWNPYLFGGMPLFASAQAGVLFPLNWFYLALPAQAAATLMTLAAYSAAALGAYLYARRSGSDIAGAVVTGLVWQWCGFLVGQIGHVNVVHTAAVLPWLLWAVESYARGGRRAWAFLLAALVAVQTFAGHQQTQAYALLLAAAYAVAMWRGAAAGAERGRYLRSVIFLAAGILMAAVQILPTLELMRNSVRASASYDFFSSFSLPPRMTLLFFAPYLYGGGDGGLFRAPYTGQAFYGEYVGYVGLATLVLAALAPLLRRDRRTIFWTAAALVCLALALGRFWPLGLYKLVYQIPVLNLFRVPARHLMEVDFALAVLAGRAVTFLRPAEDRAEDGARRARLALVVGAVVFALTCLAVTAWRPAEFRLGREAPATLLRAPELFMPVLVALAGAWAVWNFARAGGRRKLRAFLPLLVVLAFDLNLWGQASGWRLSPTRLHPLWREPSVVARLRDLRRTDGDAGGRVLTEVYPFVLNTGRDEEEKYLIGEYMQSMQPDTYMMHGVENAAGYDGFGLARYSRLAGDMKLWGELTDPQRSVHGAGREFDILNVRHLVTKNERAEEIYRRAEMAARASPSAAATREDEPQATVSYGEFDFAADELQAPSLKAGERLVFTTRPSRVERVGLVTSLSWSGGITDGTTVARVRLRADDGRTFDLDLRAGEHTSEWAHDRPNVRAVIRHRRAPVATSYKVEDASGDFEGHTYVGVLTLPEPIAVVGGHVEVVQVEGAPPELALDVKRVSLAGQERTVPLRREQVRKAAAPASETAGQAGAPPDAADASAGGRWRHVAEETYLSIYENTRALPRAWLAPETLALADEETLRTIRTGRLPDGRAWEPRSTVLVAPPHETNSGDATGDAGGAGDAGEARVTRHEPNRVDVAVSAKTACVLVLAENHYPGWRAYVDGAAVETLRVNYNLRGVTLAPGEHAVSFVYRPKSVLIGLLISLLTAGVLAAWCLRWPDRLLRRRTASATVAEGVN